jgi:nicotinamidase-related amidase
MTAEQHRGVWDGSECALVFIDYQDSVIADVWEQDRRVVELHARILAMAAVGFGVPVVLSTVTVKMGKNTPIIRGEKDLPPLLRRVGGPEASP